MKHRLFEFLTSEMGFTAIVMEGGMAETYPINESLQKEAGGVSAPMADAWPMYTQEVSDLFTWMRQVNKSAARRLGLFGIDMRKPRPAIANVRRFLAEVDPAFSTEVYKTLESALQQPNPPQNVRDAGTRDATDVLDHLRAKRNVYAASGTLRKADWAIQNARIVLQAATFLWSTQSSKVRDQAMADNVDWILEQDPAAKIVVWAHNDHIAKEPNQLGGYLAARHGSAYRTFGFAFHEGRYNAIAGNGLAVRDAASSYPESVEYFLYRSGIPRFVLDLHAPTITVWLRPMDWRNIGSVHIDGFGPNPRLTTQFDALIFFDRTTPSHLLAVPPRL